MAKGALEGVKVVDFTWAVVGPLTCKYLSDNGATVVKVESSTRIDISRTLAPFRDRKTGVNRSGYFSSINSGKYSVTLNLKHAKAIEVAKRLVAWADVVVESMRGGAMSELGLGYEELKKVNPALIMLSTCMYGQTGPHASHPGYGLILTSLSGFNHIIGWPDRGPSPIYGPYTDFIAPRFSALAILAALDYRRRTGKGQYLDMSQYENGIHFLAPLVLDHVVNGREPARIANRCPYAAPHGVYRCKGDDRWCAIAVFTDEEWKSFCQAIGNPDWTKDARFATMRARLSNVDELDRLIEEWTAGYSAEDVMKLMQSAGVASAVVSTGEDICNNAQLDNRHFFVEVDHPEIGRHRIRRQGFIMSETPCEVRRPPLLGEHNEFVYTRLLGMADEDFVQLHQEGVFE